MIDADDSYGPFLGRPRLDDGVLTAWLSLPAVLRFGPDFLRLRELLDDHAGRYELGKPPAPPAYAPRDRDPDDDGERLVRLGPRRRPTANQLVLARWLVDEQAAVCERVSQLFLPHYLQFSVPDVGADFGLAPGDAPFFPVAVASETDRILEVGDVYLAPHESLIGLVLPCVLSEYQPRGVRITGLKDYKFGGDDLAYVTDEF